MIMESNTIKLPIETLPSAGPMRRRLEQFCGQRRALLHERRDKLLRLKAIEDYLQIADSVEKALDKLTEQLFGDFVRCLEDMLTIALKEVLEQPISLKVERDFKNK